MFNSDDLVCPYCKNSDFDPFLEEDGMFFCIECGKICGCYCFGCKQFFRQNRFGLHGDVFECKECGKIHWGMTELMRKKASRFDYGNGLGS